ncbi:precorrin-2 C(20)-methyltransferase [Peptostreptococcus equinus]|uniref:Cobalt-precorrin-2 C(20)-methyltransferase n=1 Tax=Peptostreptococcus equinus TaxID=3003601 RepID=A0ABY7JRK0_9FIRM|nr:precorrin-2 C(20)-methyltransferase [Peptostreptococcus sp. CBA3647]WAW15104.1 precorrin-2 C(20)-methyltransferase [Peptostreptococcus sp. CBA3647]
MNNKAKLYGIGVGPGDPELLTIKAIKTIEKIDILYTPLASEKGESTSKKIISEYIRQDLEIKERHFPMTNDIESKISAWDLISIEIMEDVKSGKSVGLISLGDPMIYSTYVYILQRVIDSIEVETIPGITSFTNISSSNNFPLSMDKEALAIVPSTENIHRIRNIIKEFDSIVLMKVYKNFKVILELLFELGLEKHAIMVSNSSMENEIKYKNLNTVYELDSIPYFSTIIINKKIDKSI